LRSGKSEAHPTARQIAHAAQRQSRAMKEKSITESMLGGADARRHPPPPDVLGYPAVLDHGLAARRAASIFRFAAPIARAARRVRPGLILLGLATDTAPLQSVLRFAGPQRWNIVDVLRDDL